ncbi:hypothetical protein PNI0197_01404 [Streptococcus pneumoniae PNI0197]|nr:hypothetical protein PNI0197_01404 [Streptococcus pneumoniae PNI0197]
MGFQKNTFNALENLFKPRQLYLQPQSCALSNLQASFLVCSLIFIEYNSKK